MEQLALLRRTESLVAHAERALHRAPSLRTACGLMGQLGSLSRLLAGSAAVVPSGRLASGPTPTEPAAESSSPRFGAEQIGDTRPAPGGSPRDDRVHRARATGPDTDRRFPRPSEADDAGARAAFASAHPRLSDGEGRATQDAGRTRPGEVDRRSTERTPAQVRLLTASSPGPGPVAAAADRPAPTARFGDRGEPTRPAAQEGALRPRIRARRGVASIVRSIGRGTASADRPTRQIASGQASELGRAATTNQPSDPTGPLADATGRSGDARAHARTLHASGPLAATPVASPVGFELPGGGSPGSASPRPASLPRRAQARPAVGPVPFPAPDPAEPNWSELLELSPTQPAAGERQGDSPLCSDDRDTPAWTEQDLSRLAEQIERLLRDEARRHGIAL